MIENLTRDIMNRHRLTSIHLFTKPDGWRCFGFRKDAKGFEASTENGEGVTVHDTLMNLDERLTAGPIKARTLKR